MTKYEVIYLFIVGFSLLLSICALIKSQNANKISMASLESSVFEIINNTKEKVMEAAEKILEQDQPDDLKKIRKQSFYTAIENNLNAYQTACEHYLDKKIDRKRFKKKYMKEIHNIVHDQNHRKYFENSVTSDYQAILEVYDKWYNK